jgi:hypothetical protein
MAKVGSFRPDAHFADDEWLDFARHQDGAEQRARLGAHLQTGCRRCEKALRFWQTVFELARQDVAYEPPDAAVRQLKGQFAFQRPKGALERAALRASLVFDSFKQPLASGVRSAGSEPRQLFYKAGRYAIRLRTESVADSGRLLIVGQVVDEDDPARALRDIAVLVFMKDATMDRTLTNGLGEFVFDGMPDAENLRIAIGVRETGFLTVALPVAGKQRGGDDTPRRSRLNWK